MLSCGPVPALSHFTQLQNQELTVLQWFLLGKTPSKRSSQKTEPAITICYQEGAVVPNQVDICPFFSVLRVSSRFRCF